MSEADAGNAPGPGPERSDEVPGEEPAGFWRAGPGLGEFAAEPFAADDPEALPRLLGRLPGDEDGTATTELHRLYSLLADEAEREALGGNRGV